MGNLALHLPLFFASQRMGLKMGATNTPGALRFFDEMPRYLLIACSVEAALKEAIVPQLFSAEYHVDGFNPFRRFEGASKKPAATSFLIIEESAQNLPDKYAVNAYLSRVYAVS